MEEEELPAQLPLTPEWAMVGKHHDSEEKNVLALLKAQQFSKGVVDSGKGRGKKGNLEPACYKVLYINSLSLG